MHHHKEDAESKLAISSFQNILMDMSIVFGIL